MVTGYSLAGQPAWPVSRHFQRRAIDIAVSWGSGDLTINDANGNPVRITGEPRDETNTDLQKVAASYVVLWGNLPGEHHWSDDGA
jgi:hypothetical protein